MKKLLLTTIAIIATITMAAQTADPFLTSIVNGVPWTDDHGKPVNAHGACIVEENGKYYLVNAQALPQLDRYLGNK